MGWAHSHKFAPADLAWRFRVIQPGQHQLTNSSPAVSAEQRRGRVKVLRILADHMDTSTASPGLMAQNSS